MFSSQRKVDLCRVAGLLFLSLIPLKHIFLEPIDSWDARSIWYFHGKILFFDQGFNPVHWTHHEFEFAHLDYPKISSLLAAQIASLGGRWNDYLPKLNLAVFLVLFQMGIYGLPFSNRLAWFSSLSGLLIAGALSWNGYMDGYLALFIFLATLYLGLSFDSDRFSYALPGIIASAITMQMKNEGILVGLLLLVYWIIFMGRDSRLGELRQLLKLKSPILFIVFFPVLAWEIFKLRYGVRNDLSQAFTWERTLNHFLSIGLWRDLTLHFLTKTGLNIVLPLSVIIYYVFRKRGSSAQYWRGPTLAWLTSATFLMFMYFIYQASSWGGGDGISHAKSSAARVMMSVVALSIAALVLIIFQASESSS